MALISFDAGFVPELQFSWQWFHGFSLKVWGLEGGLVEREQRESKEKRREEREKGGETEKEKNRLP